MRFDKLYKGVSSQGSHDRLWVCPGLQETPETTFVDLIKGVRYNANHFFRWHVLFLQTGVDISEKGEETMLSVQSMQYINSLSVFMKFPIIRQNLPFTVELEDSR